MPKYFKEDIVDKMIAEKLSEVIEVYSKTPGSLVKNSLPPKLPLRDFHQWADGRPFESGFLLENRFGSNVWLLIVEWNPKNGFYVVLFPEDKSGPVAEIHTVLNEGDGDILKWRYSPSKRDGQNEKRKTYFNKYFLDLNVLIALPSTVSEVHDFAEELISLYLNRLKADNLDEDTPDYRDGFPEGKLKERLHVSRERNSSLIRVVKKEALSKYGKLVCECCSFDFALVYGDLGHEFIEAHHTVPVSELHSGGEETKKEDIALVCSNCHRMLHRRRPWLSIGELKSLANYAK